MGKISPFFISGRQIHADLDKTPTGLIAAFSHSLFKIDLLVETWVGY